MTSPLRILIFAARIAMLVATLVSTSAAWGAENVAPPNILVIVADDLGFAEVNCQGQPIATPHINSIGKQGVCCTNGYVTCPVCSPTRAGLLTGRYQQRFGHEFNPGPAAQASGEFGLPLSESTLADRLKKLGYATGIVGKWHLGYRPEFFPLKRGFDEFFGFLGGAHSYVDSEADKNNRVYRNQQVVEAETYLTNAFGREAVAFIDRHKQHPFFLYLAFNAVHAPLQAPDKYLQRFASIADEKRRTFAAMLSAMDDNVGQVLDKIAQEKLDQQTLIFFISDNGGPTAQTSSSNAPLRGFKTQVLEGGIRVPFMVQWKDKLPAGKQFDQPVISLDIVPTALAAAGAAPPTDGGLDGVDLVPYLAGAKTTAPHENLYWRFGQQWAIRQGDFKLLNQPQGGRQLYDLAHDVGEQHNLVTERPELARSLEQAWQQWNSQLAAPRWQREAARAKAQGKKGKARRAGQNLSN